METTGAKAVTKSAWHRWRQDVAKCLAPMATKRRQKCLAPMETTGDKTSPKVPGTNGDKRRKKYFKKGIEYSIIN
jgi:hypothetical protein